jgi:hypothetical protein
MTKQLLIYTQAQHLSSERHREWSVKAGDDYSFAKEVNSIPLTAIEFPNAATEYPIVFAGEGDSIMPVAVMGIRDNENLFIAEDGKIDAKYNPAFLRRYPFVFSSSDEGDNFTLCIDETFEGCNQENRGERLFDSEGEQTQYLKNVLEFLKEYQVQFARTQAFCKKLNELELLEPMGAEFNAAGQKLTLTGFMAINREKLKNLSGEQLAELAKTDGLELAYLSLQSLRNFTVMVNRIVPTAEPTTAPTAEKGIAIDTSAKKSKPLKKSGPVPA